MKQELFILPTDSSKGGAETILHLIAKEHAKDSRSQLTIAFLTDNLEHGWDDLGGLPNVSLLFTKSKSVWRGIPKLVRNLINLRKKCFDVCFTSHTDMTGLGGLLKRLRLLNVRCFVARESCSVFLRYKKLPLRFRIHHALGYPAIDLLVCQTQQMKEQFVEGAPQLARRIQSIEVLPNPIDLDLIQERADEPIRTNFSPECRYIVAAGRLIPIKGYDLLIKAFSQLRQEPILEDMKLVILGEGNSRPYLETLAEELGIADTVELRGNVENVYPYFGQATLCVVSSLLEGFPNVLLQMMSQCDRVVSTLCAGGIDKLDGVHTCPPSDITALYDTMRNAMQDDASKNRFLFDSELKKRSITLFVQKLDHFVQMISPPSETHLPR